MSLRIIPGRLAVLALAACAVAALIALVLGMPVRLAGRLVMGAMMLLAVAAAWDAFASRRAWRRAAPRMTRRLPPAFAIGVRQTAHLVIVPGDGDDDVSRTLAAKGGAARIDSSAGDAGATARAASGEAFHCILYDHADNSLATEGLPLELTLATGKITETSYTVTPSRRGEITFAPADVRVRSRWGLWELLERLGPTEMRRVYPDFAQIARYAWLAGDRRLQEIGIKTYQLRGQGTDFKQLSEYRVGDPVRHIDWKASLRIGKPIVREFQDDRDQNVLLLIDCGRRMRADDRNGAVGTTHFDQVLNAVMLLSYVALRQGDAVGAMTFGTPAAEARSFTPRKGTQALNAMMGHLYAVQPTPTHSDYVAAARDLVRRHRKRSLVIVITNFRDEDSSELGQALRLLRPRHLVMLASLRERIVGELIEQPLAHGEAAIEVASAHLYEQSRRDAFNRLATGESLMVDAEPERLGVELVNRYHAVKRAGLI
jgi:uncharacterized protein (DUF58 family)